MSKIKRLVQVLHKLTSDGLRELRKGAKDVADPSSKKHLAVGRVFTFRSGDQYQVMPTGAVERLNPKPWRNKAERKRVLRARRLERAQ